MKGHRFEVVDDIGNETCKSSPCCEIEIGSSEIGYERGWI